MYNTERLYKSLNNMTPIEYKNMKPIAWFTTFLCVNNGVFIDLIDITFNKNTQKKTKKQNVINYSLILLSQQILII